MQDEWRGSSLDDALTIWWQDDETESYRVVPFIISWGLWIARNDAIFKGRLRTPVEIATKAVGIIIFYLDTTSPSRIWPVVQDHIN